MNPEHIICWLDAIDVGFYRIWDKFSPHLMLLGKNSEQNRRQSQFSKSELMSHSTHRWGLARCQQWGLKIERDILPLQSPVNRSLFKELSSLLQILKTFYFFQKCMTPGPNASAPNGGNFWVGTHCGAGCGRLQGKVGLKEGVGFFLYLQGNFFLLFLQMVTFYSIFWGRWIFSLFVRKGVFFCPFLPGERNQNEVYYLSIIFD